MKHTIECGAEVDLFAVASRFCAQDSSRLACTLSESPFVTTLLQRLNMSEAVRRVCCPSLHQPFAGALAPPLRDPYQNPFSCSQPPTVSVIRVTRSPTSCRTSAATCCKCCWSCTNRLPIHKNSFPSTMTFTKFWTLFCALFLLWHGRHRLPCPYLLGALSLPHSVCSCPVLRPLPIPRSFENAGKLSHQIAGQLKKDFAAGCRWHI